MELEYREEWERLWTQDGAVLYCDWYFLQRKGCCWKCHAVGVADGDRMKLSAVEKHQLVFLWDFGPWGSWTHVLVMIEADGCFRARCSTKDGEWKLRQHSQWNIQTLTSVFFSAPQSEGHEWGGGGCIFNDCFNASLLLLLFLKAHDLHYHCQPVTFWWAVSCLVLIFPRPPPFSTEHRATGLFAPTRSFCGLKMHRLLHSSVSL